MRISCPSCRLTNEIRQDDVYAVERWEMTVPALHGIAPLLYYASSARLREVCGARFIADIAAMKIIAACYAPIVFIDERLT